MRFFELLGQDIRAAARNLSRSSGFAIAAVTTLALGIGANTAIFSLINTTLLRPLPYPNADRIVQLWRDSPEGEGVTHSIPVVTVFAAQTSTFRDFAAYDFGGPGVNITDAGEPEQVKAIHVSAGYFRLFGARIEAGRTFTLDEDRPKGGRVVVLSHGLWVRRFNSDRRLVGRTISLGNEPYVVTGVLSADFQPDPPAQIWLPLQLDLNSVSQASYLRAAARLTDGITMEEANAALKLATADFHRKFPLAFQKARLQAKPFRETSVRDIRAALLVLFGAVTLVLLIACSNVANLQLARSLTRRREIAIRAALGASRLRLIAQLLTESLLLSLAGAVLGLIAGHLCLRGLLAVNPDAITGRGESGLLLSLDWRVLAFTAALSVAATVVFGLLPALRSSDTSLTGALEDGGVRAGAGRATMETRSLLVFFQVAVAVVLFVGAGLMIRTFASLRGTPPGIDPHRILTLDMALEGTRYRDTAAVSRLVDNGVAGLRQIPGVVAAATSWTLPVELAFASTFKAEGNPLTNNLVDGDALMRPVSPEYAAVFGIPLLRGRFFTAHDTADSGGVAVISNAMAVKFWPNRDPIGERITLDKYLGPDFAAPPREIVGVAGDVRDVGLSEYPQPMIYVPQAQVADGMTRIDIRILPITWCVRTASEPYLFRSAVRTALRDASGGLAIAHIRSMDEVVSHSTARSDFNAFVLTIFGFASLLLAAIGIYGLSAFAVEQRSREIGIRLALGAAGSQVRNMLVFQAMRLAAGGLIAGAAASVGAGRFMRSMIYGIKPMDLATIASSILALGVVAAFACYFPARRASRLDPARVLRSS